jgi:hypothetical protein
MGRMPRIPTLQVAVLLACCSLALASCTTVRREHATVESPARHRQIYALGELHLADALYYKPAGSVSGLDAYAAPLIAQELLPSGRIGRVRVDEHGQASVEADAPTVYYRRLHCTLDDRDYEQLIFLWFYASSVEPPPGSSLPVQGVRMTLDSEGLPLIWEQMVHNQPDRIIFASRNLETRARQQYGSPLPGRRYSLEISFATEPDAIVARVLEDGPLLMGPIVHLLRDGSVGTLSCRCMPSQVDHFVETLTYDLVPLQELADLGLHGLGWIMGQQDAAACRAFSPDDTQGSPLLSTLIRLPDDF